MTVFLWLLAALGFVLWSLAGAAMGWSIWALTYGYESTSHLMARLPVPLVALICLVAGLVVGFVAGHFFWGQAQPK